MSRELARRLAKVEAKHRTELGLDGRISRMTDAELTTAIRACNGRLEAELGPGWREWLAENDPSTDTLLHQLEREGVQL